MDRISSNDLLNLGCHVPENFLWFLKAATLVEPLGPRLCLQLLQSDLVDVVMGINL